MGALNEDEATRAAPRSEKPAEPVLLEPEKVIWCEFGMPDGSTLEGNFVVRVPTLADRAAMARTRAALCNGLPFDAFAQADRILLDAMARCEVLFSKDRDAAGTETTRAPAWWYTRGPGKLGAHIVIALSEAALEHERLFFRADEGAGPEATGRCFAKVLPADGRADGAAR